MGRIHRMTIHLLGMRTAPAAVFTAEVCPDHAKPSWAILRPIFSASNCGRKLLWVCDLAPAVPVSDAVLECQETTKCRKGYELSTWYNQGNWWPKGGHTGSIPRSWEFCAQYWGTYRMPILKGSGVVFLSACVWKRKAAQWALSRLTARPRNP